MATYTLTPAQLKGAGIYNSFEIPAGGGAVVFSTNSFLFDGVDDEIQSVDQYDELNSSSIDYVTFSVWVKPVDTTSRWVFSNPKAGTIVDWASLQFGLFIKGGSTSGTTIQFTTNNQSGFVRIDGVEIPLNEWSHIAIQYNKPGGGNYDRVNIWLNGVQQTKSSTPIAYFYTTLSGGRMFIGENAAVAGNNWSGGIDEFAIFKDVLVNPVTLFNSGVPNNLNDTDIYPTSPVTWYRMGESGVWDGRDWVITDQGSGGSNGLSQNMAEEARTTDVPS